MTESESVALPLGDAPICGFLDYSNIIPQKLSFVKGVLKIYQKNLLFLFCAEFDLSLYVC
jgi:hypothetical protein